MYFYLITFQLSSFNMYALRLQKFNCLVEALDSIYLINYNNKFQVEILDDHVSLDRKEILAV